MAIADKFYTKIEVAKKCVNFLKSKLSLTMEEQFLEPTAGNGVFLNFLNNYDAYDLLPENPKIKKQDIFLLKTEYKNYITIGNPPFGKRSLLAINVFNKCAEFSDVIAFIVPMSFMKFNVQKNLNTNFKLIDFFFLEENSFLDRDKDFDVNCVFQIWVKNNSKYDNFKDLRILKQPSITSSDFKIWQYNATQQSFNTVNEDWEIATYRQGYKNYNEIFNQSDKYKIIKMMSGNRKVQFFFIKPLNENSKKIILSMDFNNLAKRNTSTPGFGKADFVSYYNELKDKNYEP